MRVAIVGAGAMGGIFGAGLRRAGAQTTLVDVSEPLVARINAEGLTVVEDGEDRLERVPATDDAGSLEPQDLVLFFVKCYHTAAAVELARPLIGADTTVVSLQNGWGNGEVIGQAVGEERLLVGVTYGSGTVLEPGRVAWTGKGTTFVGAYDGAGDDRVAAFAGLLGEAGFDVEVPERIRTEIWKKLVLNCATLPTAALTGLTAGGLGHHEAMLEVVDAAAREAVVVAQAAGHPIEADERIERIHGLLAKGGAGKASMLQDVEGGRRTELDVITGAILREADVHGIDVPVNRALFALVRGLEDGRGLR